MFAVFLHEGMNPFYHNVSSFPTVIFTIFLGVSLLYWLIAIMGLVDIEILDLDGDFTDGDMSGLGGVLFKFGLNGVPFTIIITFIAFFGWIISYVLVAVIQPLIPFEILEFVSDVVIFLVAFYFATLITSVAIKPLRTLFKKMDAPTIANVLGQSGLVRSSRLDKNFGEVLVADGGAGLLLRARTRDDNAFEKGAEVILIEYDQQSGIYYVVSKSEIES